MNQRIGYARASADDLTLGHQRRVLAQSGCATIYEETAGAKVAARPGLEQCRKVLGPGDTLVVWRLDRLARSLSDLVQIVVELEQHGVRFESLSERIDTSSAADTSVAQVFAALAQFERNVIRERAHAGLSAARARGRAGGRKPKLDAEQISEIKQLMTNPELSVGEIAKRYKVSRATIYKVVSAQSGT
ncbi:MULTISPECIES: recombinase family protein [unclassified Burkholderia]|uniref:recombinase family protein n=1 Tax=unclassified Burkholderia TaxID=2613784 RepID=UPI00141FD190|nr:MULTISPECIES: recombinase family protein [unclassified Burkholderia]NIE83024.1 recombinase family protein [Burkholderia sp. Tr-860]NIF62119.1 recombinase family protein [Burkholderia sp. Cy-647]NIF96259.1 recombinase family protein [Burkholderia sp. Ax-1720]